MQPTQVSWECPQCLQINSVRDLRCPRCNCLNPNAHHSTMRTAMATSTKSNLPIAVFWFVVAFIILLIDFHFWQVSQQSFSMASSDRANATQYASDCSPSAVATGTAGVMAVQGHLLDYEAYEAQHEGDPCYFAALPALIHHQDNNMLALRPPGYYVDTDSDKEPNVSVRLAPSPTLAGAMAQASGLALLEYWSGHCTAVTFNSTRFPTYLNPNAAADRDSGTGYTWRLVAIAGLLVSLLCAGVGVIYLRKTPS